MKRWSKRPPFCFLCGSDKEDLNAGDTEIAERSIAGIAVSVESLLSAELIVFRSVSCELVCFVVKVLRRNHEIHQTTRGNAKDRLIFKTHVC